MEVIPLSNLIIPKGRQRQHFDDGALEDLASSIESKGLMHPPVVRNDGRTLVAGERRARAIAFLNQTNRQFKCNGMEVPALSIPVVRLAELSDFNIREAELEENLLREDLTWQEEARALAELTELRREVDPTWTVLDTAREVIDRTDKELPSVYSKAREAEVIKRFIDDPDVAAAKSSREAIKVIKRKEEAKENARLAEAAKERNSPHTIINGDMREVLPTLKANTYSVIVTDPPYGINADKFGDMADARHEYEDTEEYALSLVETLAVESFRIATDQAHAYIFCDIRLWGKFAARFQNAGWEIWPTPLIWYKANGMLPKPEYGPRRVYEAILFANKGQRKVNSVQGDVITIPGLSRPKFGAEKPTDLFFTLLNRSAIPGDNVLDCFAGAGPIIPAANRSSVTATAIEMNPEKYNYIMTRLDERINADPGEDLEALLAMGDDGEAAA